MSLFSRSKVSMNPDGCNPVRFMRLFWSRKRSKMNTFTTPNGGVPSSARERYQSMRGKVRLGFLFKQVHMDRPPRTISSSTPILSVFGIFSIAKLNDFTTVPTSGIVGLFSATRSGGGS